MDGILFEKRSWFQEYQYVYTKKMFWKILKTSEIFKIYIFLHHKWSQSSISKFILSIWYTLYNFCFFFLTWRDIIFGEEVRNSILGYPSLKNKNFGTFLGEIYRINPEILGYPRIPGYPLTTSLSNLKNKFGGPSWYYQIDRV